jgi:predicted CXXCH cytochrome family protein
MKTLIRILTAVFLGTVMLSNVVWAEISGSPHDFSGQFWSGGQVCNACHTPHNSDTAVAVAPLWNHSTTTATFYVYDDTSSTVDSTIGQPRGISLLCLSCHDGTVAVDSYGGAIGLEAIASSANIGGGSLGGGTADLSDDHPISFTYSATLAIADGELRDPSAVSVPLFGAGSDQLECATCHDVHNNAPATAGNMLRIDNDGSDLCFECHLK